MRTGDIVKHGPSGEIWTVAFVEGDRLSWCGWPPGSANITDCALVESCDDKKYDKLLRDLAAMKPDRGYDARQSWALSELERTDAEFAFEKMRRLTLEIEDAKNTLFAKQAAYTAARDVWLKLHATNIKAEAKAANG